MSKIYTTDNVKRIIAEYASGSVGVLAPLYSVYVGLPFSDAADAKLFIADLERDIAYDPDPYISTMDYTPSDRIIGCFNAICDDKVAEKLSCILSDVNGSDVENYFRWHAGDVVKRAESILGDEKAFAAIFFDLRTYAENGERRVVCALSWYIYALLSYRGYICAPENSLLLRRVNCRPWGLKFFR